MIRKAFLLLIIIGIGWFLFNTAKIAYKKYNINLKIAEVKKEIEALQAKNEKLKSLFDILKSPDFLEKEARKKFNLQKEGEKAVVIIDEKKEKKEQNQIQNEKSKNLFDNLFANSFGDVLKEESKENIRNWIDYFFN